MMNVKRLLQCVLLSFFFSCGDQHGATQSQLQEKLSSLLQQEHDLNLFDGTVVIGTQDSIIFSKAIGTSNRVWDVPLQLNHRLDICSVNKSFIATLILLASEEEKINLEDRLVDWIDSYTYAGKFDEHITIHHLLTHTSGLADYNGVSGDLSASSYRSFKRLHFSNNQYVDFISKLTPLNKPGKEFYYSNFAYHLLTIILEDVYERPFSEILESKICAPLGLNETFSTTSNETVYENVAEAYIYNETNDSWNRNGFIDLTLGRRIFSSALDLYKWGKAMNDQSFLSESSQTLMQTNHLSDISQDLSYGYGWVVFDGQGSYKMGDLDIDKNYIIHGGNTEGYKSMLVNIENGEYIVAMLSNTGNQTNELLLTQRIVQLLLNHHED